MSDEVGKVCLGLELVGGGDLNKQISMAAGTIGEQLTKSLQSTFKGFSLKSFASNISQTLKATTEIAMKGIADGMESTVTTVEGRLIKTISVADQAMRKSIEDNKMAAEAAIDSVGAKLGGLKAPSFISDLPSAAAAAVAPTVSAPKAAVRKSGPAVDEESVKDQISQLTAVLDNTNAKIDIQRQKLSELKGAQGGLTEAAQQQMNALEKESAGLEEQIRKLTSQIATLKAEQKGAISGFHAGMIGDEIAAVQLDLDGLILKADETGRKMADLQDTGQDFKLKEKIVNTEAALLRLTQSSDKTSNKIRDLEDSLNNTGQAATKVQKPVQNLGQKMIQTNKPLKAAKGNLDQAAKAATKASSSFGSAARSSTHMGNSFTKAIGRILKQVFVFAVIYKAIRSFNDYMGSALKTNVQFAASLNAIQTNLRVAFQPIYEAILPAINALMSALAKITAYIAAFISALFGKTYQQSYQAAKGIETAKKAMEGYGKSSKKAGKEAKGALASFDELNTLDFSKADTGVDDGSGGGKGFEMQMPDMDITGIQAKMDALAASVKATFDKTWQGIKAGWDWTVAAFGPSFMRAWNEIAPVLNNWKEQFQKVFSDIMTLGEPLKNWILTGVVPAWQTGIQLAGHVLAGLLDIVLQVFTSIWDAAFPIINKFVTEGLPRLSEFVMGAQDTFWSLFDLVKQIFDDIWQGVVDPVMKLISKIIQDTLDIIFKWWDDWGKEIVKGVKTALDGIKELWNNLWNSFLKTFITNMLDKLTELWDKHLKGLVTEVGTFVGKLASAALDIFNKFILPIVNWLVKTLGPTFSEVFTFLGGVLVTAIGAVVDFTKGIIKALGGLMDFIAGVFTGDWTRAWNGIKTVFSGVWDGIVGILKGAVNIIIDAINFLIQQLNKIKIDVPDWVGKIPGVPDVDSIGFNIPKIPRLAKGGLAYGPTLAMVGDNKGASADPEVISPLSTLQDMLSASNQAVVEALMMILEALKSGDKETVLKIGETEFGRIAARAIGHAERQAGRALFAR
ncbi:hypothetical protein M3201_18655 [Paenibacillus motobuensis]|uniref:phage tail protein n=1 Tax=Paenibacillus TaxID=44249 RepID=UPI00203B39E1|nr:MULTISPECIES: hypothetical protein [Paenibacillus]MCM3041718.1 hypothetical protein [Paenibacillus lutimineralis]MCM3648822.1 hypothetical protein [Paenibacillus motobuensis]